MEVLLAVWLSKTELPPPRVPMVCKAFEPVDMSLNLPSRRWQSGVSSRCTDQDQNQTEQGSRATAKDIPGGVVGESPGECVADLVCRRMGCVHSDDQQDAADDQQNDSDSALRTHD